MTINIELSKSDLEKLSIEKKLTISNIELIYKETQINNEKLLKKVVKNCRKKY